MARPSKLTLEVQNKLVDLIKAGSYSATAAQVCGISPSTYYNWMRDGRDALAKQEEGHKLTAGNKRYLEFMHAIKEAEAIAESIAIAQIRRAAQDGSWQAAAWYLERKHAERWGRIDRHQVETTITEAASQGAKSHDELIAELQKLDR